MPVDHDGVACGQARAEAVALLLHLGDPGEEVIVLLPLPLQLEEPSGIGVPGPPPRTRIIGLLTIFHLIFRPMVEGPVVVFHPDLGSYPPPYRILHVNVWGKEIDIIRDIRRYGKPDIRIIR